MFAPMNQSNRPGSSYLEVQVAMVLMSLGAAGLYSMSVVQTRQTARLTALMPATETAAMTRAADPWERKLGVYATVGPTTVPDAPVQPDVPVETIIDDHDFANMVLYKDPADTYDWTSWSYTPSYGDEVHYHYSTGNVGTYVDFVVSGLAPGEYEVFTTYPTFTSLGTAIIHEIRDGGSLVFSTTVDQTVAPSQLSYNGAMWDKLAFVQINSGTLRVRLKDGPGATNYIIADAIMVRSRRSLEVVAIAETTDGGVTATLQVVP